MNAEVPMSNTTGPWDDGNPKAIGLVPSAARAPPNGATLQAELAVDADEIRLGDHLDIVCAAARSSSCW
jgi:hypothetical protein